ncbi:MAG: SGNH/GDSL hydrolase family protein [Candidatus Krumholzibacteriia bacterium]
MSARKKALFSLAALAAAFIAAAVLAEIILRVVPLPGVVYNTFYYDELTGGHFYPNTTNIYRNERGDAARRRVNSWGYLDREHDVSKAPGVTRIGFFGDSYTEARQVPFENTFYRLVERALNDRGTGTAYECISLGFSGNSTLQCYLESGRWADRLDLDWIVYVFSENDLGDQIREIRGLQKLPFARLDGDSFVVDNAFRQRFRYKTRRLHRTLEYLRAHSLVISTVETRLRLLKRRGIRLKVTEAERYMAERSDKNAIPTSGVAPSMWPDSLAGYARELGGRVMRAWTSDVRRSGRKFAVAYVPRPREMSRPYAEQDSWAGWLASVCLDEGLDLVDPSPAFLAELERGGEIYYDHMTPAGHAAFASTLVDYFLRKPVPETE